MFIVSTHTQVINKSFRRQAIRGPAWCALGNKGWASDVSGRVPPQVVECLWEDKQFFSSLSVYLSLPEWTQPHTSAGAGLWISALSFRRNGLKPSTQIPSKTLWGREGAKEWLEGLLSLSGYSSPVMSPSHNFTPLLINSEKLWSRAGDKVLLFPFSLTHVKDYWKRGLCKCEKEFEFFFCSLLRTGKLNGDKLLGMAMRRRSIRKLKNKKKAALTLPSLISELWETDLRKWAQG